jgi:hypothetical protein
MRNIVEWLIQPFLLLAGVPWPSGGFVYDPGKLYGCGPCVNSWMNRSPWPIARALAKAGCNCGLIEALGWAGTQQYTDGSKARKAIRSWLSAFRHYRLTLLIVFANRNSQQTKYGHTAVSWSDWKDEMRRTWNAILGAVGDGKGAIVQAVAESHNGPNERAVEAYVMQDCRHRGILTAAENGGATSAGQASMAIRHPGSTSDKGQPGLLIVTDSGGILGALCGGDWQRNYAVPDVLRTYAGEVRGRGAGFIFYGGGFEHKKPDMGAIKALAS